MNFLADESLDRHIVESLRQSGHVVWYIAEMDPGITDEAVLDLAYQEDSVLLTADKDFGELVFRQRRLTSGILLVRLAGLLPVRKAEIVTAAVNQHGADLPGAFAVLTPKSLRIRRLK